MENKKRNIKCIIIVIILMIIVSGVSVYATNTYLASQVTYKEDKSVEEALNDLYNKYSQQSFQRTISLVGEFSGKTIANTKASTVSVTGLTVGKSYLFVCFRPYTGGKNAYMRNDTDCYQCTFSNVTSATFLEESYNNFVIIPSSDTVTVSFPAFSASQYSDYGSCPYVFVYNV